MSLSLFSLKQCVIKQLLNSVFVISRIIKVSARVEPFSQPYVELTISSPFSGFIHCSMTH